MNNISDFFITTVFSYPQSTSKCKLWNDKKIWGVIRTYPKELRENFEIIRQSLKLYITMGEISELSSIFELDFNFLKRFYYYLSKTECLEESFAKARGFYLNFGLIWCKYKIQEFYQKYLSPPKYNVYPYDSMKYYIRKGIFKQFGINSWQDLICESLIGQLHFSPDRYFIRGQAGLERVKKYLNSIYENEGRLPKVDDVGIYLISKAARRGIWSKYEIKSWDDLLWSIFGEKCIPAQSRKTLQSLLKKKEPELIAAKAELMNYYYETSLIPTRKQFLKINQRCNSKYWSQYGINKWLDLLQEIFGDSILNRFMPFNLEEKLARAKLQLEIIVDEFKHFFELNQRYPKWNDKGIPSIISKIKKGIWHNWGIYFWKDMIAYTYTNS